MYDDAYTRNEDGELAVRTVNVTEGSNSSSYDDVFTRDENGKLALRVVGSGGGDQHNLGYYATQAALEEAHPTAEAGDWAIVGETDTVWVWDEDGSAWVDTDTKGEVTPDMIIVKSLTMPSASATPAGAVYQYIGATNATYTHGYIYENVKSATYTGTVSFEAATLSGTTVTCSGADFANFLTEAGADPTPIVSGTMTYEADANGWRLVGKDSNDNTVTTFIEYVEDYEDAGFVFTGTPQDNDVIAFTCTVEEASATYTWTRIDVQPAPVIPDPLPSQTGQSGKFLTTDGTDASWSNTIGSPLYIKLDAENAEPFKVLSSSNAEIIVSTYFGFYGSCQIQMKGLNNKYCTLNYKADSSYVGVYPQGDNTYKFGDSNKKWSVLYAYKLNNGGDITVPTTGGTMAVIGVNTTATLAVADWSSNTQTVTVSGVKADSVVFVSPDPTSASDYASAGILCTSQSADSLTFTATTTPSVAITVNIVCL